ncbi:MAG: hypothetical protein ACKOQ3_13130 [Novosphingobium sp.]
MELGFNHLNGLRPYGDASRERPETAVFDWLALQARFAAAYCARRELGRFDSGPALPRGGFTAWQRGAGLADRATPDVNPIDLAVRKGAVGMVATVADTASCSGRGLK